MTSEEMYASIKVLLDAKIDANRAESEAHFAALEQSTKVAFVTAQIAIDKADAATEKRFESVNEFRSQLNDQAVRFATRELLDASIEKLALQISRLRDDNDALAKRIDLRQGREDGTRISTAGVVTLVTTVIALVGLAVLLARSFAGR